MKKEIDRKLLAALQAQNPQGLEDAIHRYSPYVAGVIRRVLGQLGTREDLEELSSDVFVALLKSAGTLREDSNLKLWLGVVARNRALKHLRSPFVKPTKGELFVLGNSRNSSQAACCLLESNHRLGFSKHERRLSS